MYPVFGRRDLDFDVHFERWLNWAVPAAQSAYSAMACNIMYDFRVQKERAEWFDEHYIPSRRLDEALARYFQDCVRTADQPHFLLDLNNSNIVAGAPSANLIDEDTRLITFLDLNGLDSVYRWAKKHPHPGYRDIFDFYEVRPDDDLLSDWLRQTVESLGEQAVVSAVLAAKREMRKDPSYRHYHPVWAALWSEFSGLLTRDFVDRWWESVGVYKAKAPRWIVPLRYTVFEAGTLVRPSVLDVGFYAHHFPSPPEAALKDGGCCVDLQTSPVSEILIHEYIHQEIDLDETHWNGAGGLCLPTSRASPANLADQRQAHYNLLLTKYYDVLSWMPRLIG